MNHFYEFVWKNFKLPNIENLYGKIILTFIVDTEGFVIEPKITKDIEARCGTEAIRVLMKYGKWLPGRQKGRLVSCSYTLPITIQSSN